MGVYYCKILIIIPKIVYFNLRQTEIDVLKIYIIKTKVTTKIMSYKK